MKTQTFINCLFYLCLLGSAFLLSFQFYEEIDLISQARHLETEIKFSQLTIKTIKLDISSNHQKKVEQINEQQKKIAINQEKLKQLQKKIFLAIVSVVLLISFCLLAYIYLIFHSPTFLFFLFIK